jgi:hypothetical protein
LPKMLRIMKRRRKRRSRRRLAGAGAGGEIQLRVCFRECIFSWFVNYIHNLTFFSEMHLR